MTYTTPLPSQPKVALPDVGELVTACAQQATAWAAQREVAFFFDFRGPSFTLPREGEQVRELVVLLLAQAIEPLRGGCVFFSADVIPHLAHQATVRLQLAYTDVPLSPPVVHALSEAISTQRPRDMAEDATAARAAQPDVAARCEALGGSFARGELRGEGGVVQAELLLPFEQLDEDRTLAREHGLQAWLIGDPPVVFEALTRRLQRLGWQVLLLPTVEAAAGQLAAGAAAPGLVLGAQHYGVDAPALAALARRLPPAVEVVLGRLADEPLPADTGVAFEIAAMPPGPGRLHRLTVRALERAHRPLRPLRDPRAALAGRPRGLVVDDNLVNQLILSEMLHVLGLEAEVANDGRQAVQSCLLEPPALVLMDLDMPVLSGLDATRELRELHLQGRLPRLPIVMVTARTEASDRVQAAAAGVDAYLEKPVALEALQATIRRVMPAEPPGAAA